MKETVLDFEKLIGKGYSDVLYDDDHRFIVLAGSRASKKSTFAAYQILRRLIMYDQCNALCIRNTGNTLKDSVYAEIEKILYNAERLGNTSLKDYFQFKVSPLEILFYRNGMKNGKPQKILFRSMDKPDKIQSISVPQGYIQTILLEEAHEIDDEEGFDKINFSIRANIPEGYPQQQFIICMNMYSQRHWIYKRFFVDTPKNAVALIKNYDLNEFLPADCAFFQEMEELKRRNYEKYKVFAGLSWGNAGNTVYEVGIDYKIADLSELDTSKMKHYAGLDFGWRDPCAIGDLYVDGKTIYVTNEYYQPETPNSKILQILVGIGKCRVIADCAEPKTIAELKKKGIDIHPCQKGKDSIMGGIRKVKEYDVIVDKRCTNFIGELELYSWEEEKDYPIDKYNHLLDGLRYVVMYLSNQSSAKTYNLREMRNNAKNNIR